MILITTILVRSRTENYVITYVKITQIKILTLTTQYDIGIYKPKYSTMIVI